MRKYPQCCHKTLARWRRYWVAPCAAPAGWWPRLGWPLWPGSPHLQDPAPWLPDGLLCPHDLDVLRLPSLLPVTRRPHDRWDIVTKCHDTDLISQASTQWPRGCGQECSPQVGDIWLCLRDSESEWAGDLGGLEPKDQLSVASHLRGRNYSTYHIGKWHLGTGAKGQFLPTRHGLVHILCIA